MVLDNATLKSCEKKEEYDGHYCTFREQAGFDALADFIDAL